MTFWYLKMSCIITRIFWKCWSGAKLELLMNIVGFGWGLLMFGPDKCHYCVNKLCNIGKRDCLALMIHWYGIWGWCRHFCGKWWNGVERKMTFPSEGKIHVGGLLSTRPYKDVLANMGSKISLLVYEWPFIKMQNMVYEWVNFSNFSQIWTRIGSYLNNIFEIFCDFAQIWPKIE